MTSGRGRGWQVRDGREVIDAADVTAGDGYKLLTAAVQPRPIAWISTVGADGSANLAPFSFFTVASRSPLALVVSIGVDDRRAGGDGIKDTLRNLRETREFVVNLPGRHHADAVTESSAPHARGADEFDLAGVRRTPSHRVAPDGVADALFAIECEAQSEFAVGEDTLVIGLVRAISVLPGLLDERLHIDTERAGFLARVAGPHYASLTGVVASH